MKRAVVALAVISSLAVVTTAFAQTAPNTTIGVSETLAGSIRDVTVSVLSAVVAAFLGWVSYWIKSKFGIEIEAKHREALQAFINRQASSLIGEGAVKLQGLKVDVKSEALASAANLAFNAIPTAMAYFGLSASKIADMIVDVIPKQPAVASAQAVALDAKNPETPSTGDTAPKGASNG